MNLLESIKKILKFIEGKRYSKNPLFFLLISLKDALWALGYWLPNKLTAADNKLTAVYREAKKIIFFLVCNSFKKYRKPVKTYFRISFCITCMNRLPHLKKTLRKNIRHNFDYPNLEFILLDYNSNDGLQKWVFKNFKRELANNTLVYYRTTEPQYIHLAYAKNISHLLASGDIVCNLDADNYTGRDFAFFINSTMQAAPDVIGVYQKNYRNGRKFVKGCGGRIFLTKENFSKLGGYDDNFIGWGHEDNDLKIRAYTLGLEKAIIPSFFLFSIPHGNHLREKNMIIPMKDSEKRNRDLLENRGNNGKYRVENKPIDFTKIKRIKLTE